MSENKNLLLWRHSVQISSFSQLPDFNLIMRENFLSNQSTAYGLVLLILSHERRRLKKVLFIIFKAI
jgi:hypothetical protein